MKFIIKAISLTLTILIKIYQYTFSPLLGPNKCRYSPTCSHYGLEAIKVHGPLYGTWLMLCRIGRCNPFGGSGYDPVPPKKN